MCLIKKHFVGTLLTRKVCLRVDEYIYVCVIQRRKGLSVMKGDYVEGGLCRWAQGWRACDVWKDGRENEKIRTRLARR